VDGCSRDPTPKKHSLIRTPLANQGTSGKSGHHWTALKNTYIYKDTAGEFKKN
jgi:hypothetical protein